MYTLTGKKEKPLLYEAVEHGAWGEGGGAVLIIPAPSVCTVGQAKHARVPVSTETASGVLDAVLLNVPVFYET